MSFAEIESGAGVSTYRIGATHVETGLTLSVVVISNDASGVVSEADAEKIINDIYQIIGTDARFVGSTATRARTALDAWQPPTPPPAQ